MGRGYNYEKRQRDHMGGERTTNRIDWVIIREKGWRR